LKFDCNEVGGGENVVLLDLALIKIARIEARSAASYCHIEEGT